MKFIWLIIAFAILAFGIIYYMNKVSPNPVQGLTAGGENVEITQPKSVTPSSNSFEPLDLSQSSGNIFVKSANANEINGINDERIAPRTIGNEDAEVKMYVFSSLTCGHCAEFHVKALKEIEKKYVDTGKVFFTYIDFPLDKQGVAGAMIARCVPVENYFSFLNILFKNQSKWAYKRNAQDVVSEYAALQGLSKADVRNCLSDKVLQKSIIDGRDSNMKKYKITSTPTTLILKGDKKEVIVGADKRAVEAALDKMLK